MMFRMLSWVCNSISASYFKLHILIVIKECMILEITKKKWKSISISHEQSVRFATWQAGLSKAFTWVFHLVLAFTWFSLIDHIFKGEKFSMVNIHKPYLPICFILLSLLYFLSFFTSTHTCCVECRILVPLSRIKLVPFATES